MARRRRDEDDPYAVYEDYERPAGLRPDAGTPTEWRIPLAGALIGAGLGMALGLGTEKVWGYVVGWTITGLAIGIAWQLFERGRDGKGR